MLIKEAIGTGPSVDAAIEDGCRQLGMSRDDVKTEILNLPVKKTLGLFGGAPARVRIYVEETPLTIAQNYLTSIFEFRQLPGETGTDADGAGPAHGHSGSENWPQCVFGAHESL